MMMIIMYMCVCVSLKVCLWSGSRQQLLLLGLEVKMMSWMVV